MRLLSGRQLIMLLGGLLPFIFVIGILVGSTSISLVSIFSGNLSAQDGMILYEIRIPRALLAGLVGAVLAMSGAVLQGLFRNPLADPSLIGVTSGASAGASVSILLSANITAFTGSIDGFSSSSFASLSVVALGAFIGGMLAVALVYRLATNPIRGTSVATMLLVGIAVYTFANAINNLMNLLADNELMRRMSLWQMGNLDLANWSRVQICIPMLAVFLFLLKGQARNLNALLLGESEARHLGVDVASMKRRLIFLTALGVGVAVALAGPIAFVGLVVPHLVRLLSGPDHRTLILASGLLGASLLIVADLLARLLLAPAELPVGVITAFLGVPFFVFLLRRQLRA